MRQNRGPAFTLVLTVLVGVGLVHSALAASLPACSAEHIIAADTSCPASGLCVISKDFTIVDGCVIDFGTRDVRVAGSSKLTIGTAAVRIEAGSFTVEPGGFIDGTTPDIGGSLTVLAMGNIAVQKSGSPTGRIRVSAYGKGGSILLDAGGDITITGQLYAHNRTAGTGDGGVITLRAGGGISITATGEVDVHGGQQASGGFLDLTAGGDIHVSNAIDLTGGEGGSVSVVAGGDVVIGEKVNATGVGDAGTGGDIEIIASGRVDINDEIRSNGTGSAIGSGGGDGGSVFISAGFGDITVRNQISARGGTPDGGGGDMELLARGSIDITSLGKVIVESPGIDGWGGEIQLEAGLDIGIDGELQANGGEGEGVVWLDAGRDVSVRGRIDASGTEPGSFGGSVAILAGRATSGNLTLGATIDVSGTGCDSYGCSLAGDFDAVACDVTVGYTGSVDATAPDTTGNGGAVSLTARGQLTILGVLDARGGGQTLDGSNTFFHPVDTAPILSGSILPEPNVDSLVVCTGSEGDTLHCLVPCPVCGNAVTEFPETCDDTTGTPENCDGCSSSCEIEDCNDGNICTHDSCETRLGCRSIAEPDGTGCPDEDVCNGEETCLAGSCRPGTPLDCEGGDPCRTYSCDPVTGCQSDPLVCDDGKECTEDSCDPLIGCVFDPGPQNFQACTDDGDPCTNDVCFLGHCVAVLIPDCCPEGLACDDGLFCNGSDTCEGGDCVAHAGNPCLGGGECASSCNEEEDTCLTPADTGCADDGNLCTSDVCDGLGSCTHPPNTEPCDDGLFCTYPDSCQGGVCGGPLRTCDDGVACTLDSCDESGGTCVNTPHDDLCDESDPCALCTCSPGTPPTGCVCLPVAECGDGQICPGVEDCDPPGSSCPGGGVCSGECGCGPRCGNGGIDTGETCDPPGEQSSCGVGFVCDATCTGCTVTRLDLSQEECPAGETVSLALTLTTAPGAEVGATANDLTWQPDVLTYIGAEEGPTTLARNGQCTDAVDQEAGTARIGCFTTDPGFLDVSYEPGVVAWLTFACAQVGEETEAVIMNAPSAAAIPPAIPVEPIAGRDGKCFITTCPDCNVVVLQTCIAAFLNLAECDPCLDTAPAGGDGNCGVVDLQNCIACFLGLL